jgi:subtilisin family serine protease
MKFEEDRRGYAFEDDYAESYDPADLARLRAILPQQVGQLGAGGLAVDAQLLGILMGRRSAGGNGRAQIETRVRRDGSLTVVARGEVLLPAAAAASVRKLFEGYEELSPTIAAKLATHVRMRPTGIAASEVDRKIDQCAAARVAAHPNYLATMAAVSKGIGGPEPTPPPPPTTPPPADIAGAGLAGASPVKVAVIDTGIGDVSRVDPWLRVERTADNVDELDVLPSGPDGLLDYSAGHGTFVAGVVQRVAPQAEVRVYRAADTDGFATDDDIAAAILQAYDDGAQVINMSMGIRTTDDTPPPATAAAVATVLADSGGATVIVASAGNFGDTSTVFPAALPGVHAVAGLTAHLAPASWSCYGDGIAFSTVAEGIRSTFVTGRESPVFDPSPDIFPQSGNTVPWAMWSGTSFAAPQIAGVVARISYEEGLEPRAAVEKLAEFGKEIAGFGRAMRILKGIG